MIELIRINGQPFLLNVLLIEQIEAFPDTTITLTNGKKIVVRDSMDEVKRLINERFEHIGLIGTFTETGGT